MIGGFYGLEKMTWTGEGPENEKKGFSQKAETLDFTGAPGKIRTCNLRIRSPALYPLSYGRF